MKLKVLPLLGSFLLNFWVVSVALSQDIPMVYSVENSGDTCTLHEFPAYDDLQNYPFLPDPFEWSDGSGRLDTFTQWECRRNEIKFEIEQYEIGPKPDRPDSITASYSNNILTVVVTENGQSLTLTSSFQLPDGDGPYPVVIGMNSGTGSLPSELFDSVIQVPFYHNQVVTYSQTSTRVLTDPYYQLYPDLTYVGNYSAWAWGVSRLIDGLELVKDSIKANLQHIAVTGCSYAGKMALYAGAYDERIALTIAQESGGGGINSWRVSETLDDVEKIENTNYSWFMQSMKTNFQGKVGLLPHDHHELMAMIVPRALLVLGNPSYVWLGDTSGYVACRATQEVYNTFGISERFGFSFRSGHSHCSLPSDSYAEVQAFVDRFLWNDTTVSTDIHVHDFYDVDYDKWINAWKEAANPNAPVISIESPEDGTVYEAPATFTVTTVVNDSNNNVSKVIFYNSDEILAQDSIAPYSFTLTDVSAGSYSIYAEAVDSTNLSGFSNVVYLVIQNPVAQVYKTDIPPVIDGLIDNVWESELNVAFNAENVLVGSSFSETDLSGSAKVLWDNTCVYVIAIVKDNVKKNDSQNTYEDDNVEFYFDANNSKGSTYDTDDAQYSFAWNNGSTVDVLPTGRSTANIDYVITDTDDGYIAEASIPWTTLLGTPTDGMKVGFDFMINDDDDGGGRDGKLSWNASADQAWQDASYFGTLQLNESVVVALVSQPLSISGIYVYPNPVTDRLFVGGVNGKFNYQIFDVGGKLQSKGGSASLIPIDTLDNGVYFINISTNDKETILKFVKQ